MDTTSDSVPAGFSGSLPGCSRVNPAVKPCCQDVTWPLSPWNQSSCSYLYETRWGPLTFLVEVWRVYKVQPPCTRPFSHPRISERVTVVGVELTLFNVLAAHVLEITPMPSKLASGGMIPMAWLAKVLRALFICLQEPVSSAQICYPPYHFISFQNIGLVWQIGDDL